MINKMVIFTALTLGSISAYAADSTSSKIQTVGIPACTSISTSAWTAFPSTTTIRASRGGIMISAPSTNTAGFGVVLSSSALGTPVVGITTFGIQMGKGDFLDLSVSQFVYTWAIALHSSAESICYQEYVLELGK